jgi:hypothetical protein
MTKIQNLKHERLLFGALDFYICDLFGACNFEFGASNRNL